jgi:superfamily II DNA or RNA helicase
MPTLLPPFPEDQVNARCEEAHGHAPRKYQMEATKALYHERDAIITDATGPGKSMLNHLIFYSGTTAKHAILVCFSPLIALQTYQVRKDKKGVFINSETKTPELLKRITDQEFARVYMGPEQICPGPVLSVT